MLISQTRTRWLGQRQSGQPQLTQPIRDEQDEAQLSSTKHRNVPSRHLCAASVFTWVPCAAPMATPALLGHALPRNSVLTPRILLPPTQILKAQFRAVSAPPC